MSQCDAELMEEDNMKGKITQLSRHCHIAYSILLLSVPAVSDSLVLLRSALLQFQYIRTVFTIAVYHSKKLLY